jgi:hypothetical protein
MHLTSWIWLPAAAAMAGLAWQNHGLERQLSALSAQLNRTSATTLAVGRAAASDDSPACARQLAAELQARDGGSRETPAPAQPAAPAVAEPARVAGAAPPDLVVARVLAQGRLGRDDVAALRSQFAAMPPEQADHARRQLAAAINRNELIPDDPRFLIP